MDFKDYYATLGVAKTASEKEIKQAFRKLARKHHPDVNPGDKVAEAKFKEINEAYEVLGDPEKRKKYDELGANWRMYEQAGPRRGQPFGGGAPFGQGGGARSGGYRTMTPEEMEEMLRRLESVLRFLHHVLRRRRRREDRPVARGRAARRAATAGSRHRARDRAGARGRVSGQRRGGSLRHNGQVKHVDVRIPAGVTDGSRVRGQRRRRARPRRRQVGDLYLRVRLQPHPRVRAEGARSLRQGAACR